MHNVEAVTESIRRRIRYTLAREEAGIGPRELFEAVARAARDLAVDGMLRTERRVREADAKRVYYLSMEFLMGRALGNNLINLGVLDLFRSAVERFGGNLDEVRDAEVDAALGNGGLGRLAACFLDSLASLDIPGYGYGINYEYGLFKQEIDRGEQKERPDHWLADGTPWLIDRPQEACIIPVYGQVHDSVDRDGNHNPMWLDWRVVIGVPHDMPIIGYGGRTVNFLRLYSARASHDFDMQIFNTGDYFNAVSQKMRSETISKVLYPSDAVPEGKELRLLQEYFFVACAVRDIVRRYKSERADFHDFPNKVALQLNDTHPALAVAELMRYFVDEAGLPWDKAWELVQGTCAYTNHTLLPEALERWSVPLLQYVLPRHLEIIYEINHRFLEQVRVRWPDDGAKQQRLSIIEESEPQHVRMANLAIVGSHAVNGVAALHSELVKSDLVPDFHEMWPERFQNKTNGVTPRRWLLKSNPGLAELITRAIGDAWVTDLDELRKLESFVDEPNFVDEFRRVKRENKEALADIALRKTHVTLDPDTMFDIQAKRIHEYKRQLLNVLHIIHSYLALTEDGIAPTANRTFVFAGKAAPGYWAAKQIIKLIHAVGDVVNNDPRVGDRLKVVFLPDYRVSLAESVFRAADLSEQISTAGMEASGTGNMKFALNGALTIGTLDGANVEMREEIGDENIYIFGLRCEEVAAMRREGSYHPGDFYGQNSDIRRVMDCFRDNRFGDFGWVWDNLMNEGDFYFLLADLESYIATQARAGQDYGRVDDWTRMAILNVARMGKFSSDRTIRQYAEEIWGVPVGSKKVPVLA